MQQVYNGMPASGLRDAAWRKSRLSNPSGNCVEVAQLPDGEVAVRNSRHPHGPALVYTSAEITAFVLGAKQGDFDHLVDPSAGVPEGAPSREPATDPPTPGPGM